LAQKSELELLRKLPLKKIYGLQGSKLDQSSKMGDSVQLSRNQQEESKQGELQKGGASPAKGGAATSSKLNMWYSLFKNNE